MNNVVKFALKGLSLWCAVAVVGCSAPPPDVSIAQQPTPEQQPISSTENSQMLTIADFNDQAEESRWRNVDDTVMGGISQSAFSITPDGYGLFSGMLSTENNGGFTSVRRAAEDVDLAGIESFVLRVRGDGRPYEFRLKMGNTDRDIFYRSEFETTDEWQTVRLPIEGFEPVFRGRIVEGAPALEPSDIKQIGFLLGSKDSGNFRLEVETIQSEL